MLNGRTSVAECYRRVVTHLLFYSLLFTARMDTNNNGIWFVLVVIIIVFGGGFLFWDMTQPGNGITATPDGTIINPPPSGATAAAPAVTTNTTATPSNSTAVITGTVTPNGAQTSYWYEYGKTTTLGSSTPSQNIGSGFISISAPAYITGLAQNTPYYFRLSASNGFGTVNGSTATFTTNTTPPPVAKPASATSAAATGVTRTAAVLNGSTNPNGSATSYWFEYGDTTDFGTATGIQSAGNGSTTVASSVTLSGLSPATKYYFRVNAQNQFGTINGTALTFTTQGPAEVIAPNASTKPATSVASTTASLNGLVNPNGAATSYWFEYSDNELLRTIVGTETPHQTLAVGTISIAVSVNVKGLTSGTTHYYRVVASNSHGKTYGDVVSFQAQ